MKTYYYGGEALPRGLYVYRDRHVTIVDEYGEWCAYDILYPSPGVRSEWPGVSSSCARIRIRRALEIEYVEPKTSKSLTSVSIGDS